jgi:hypothetical protein
MQKGREKACVIALLFVWKNTAASAGVIIKRERVRSPSHQPRVFYGWKSSSSSSNLDARQEVEPEATG